MIPKQSTRAIFMRFSAYLTHYKLAFITAIVGMIGYSTIDVFVISQLENAIDLSLVNGDLDYLRIAAYLIVPLFILRGILNFMGGYTFVLDRKYGGDESSPRAIFTIRTPACVLS